jgi:hypothetical protein
MKLRSNKHLLVGVAVVALAAVMVLPVSAGGFTRGIVINVDDVDYYLAGPPGAPRGGRETYQATIRCRLAPTRPWASTITQARSVHHNGGRPTQRMVSSSSR